MKIGHVKFDLNKFGGTRPLMKIGEPMVEKVGALEGHSGPSGPSGPSKNPLFILEVEEQEIHKERKVETTIRNTGTTRTTGTGNTPLPQPSKFRFAASAMEFGDVCAGWTPEGWACELRRKAERCESCQPDMAAHYRRWAEDIEGKLEAT